MKSFMINATTQLMRKYFNGFTVSDVSVKDDVPWTNFHILIDIENGQYFYEGDNVPLQPGPTSPIN